MKEIILIVLYLATCTLCCQDSRLIASGISQDVKTEIVKYHNQLRSRVATGSVQNQPAAKNMLQFRWDDEIAKKAQDWANNCVYQHDSSDNRRVSRFSVGQNLAITMTSNNVASAPEFNRATNMWFNEYKDYKYGKIESGKNQNTGHYTQLAWANTYYIGCGYSYYFQDNWYKKYYVCNYGPAGNYIGQYPYESGQQSCGSYNYKNSNDYKGLCKNF